MVLAGGDRGTPGGPLAEDERLGAVYVGVWCPI